MYQKLERCKFSSDEFDFDNHEIEAQDEESEVNLEESQSQAPSKAGGELFRDKLAKAGGKLNHNLIKLKYEKRHLAPSLAKRPPASS